jgi:hypothetical protein
VTADEYREIALGMEGAVERAHMGHPDFRANGGIFATLHAGEQSGALKLSPDEQRELIRLYPKVFTPASGAWGRQGWTTVLLAAADSATVRGAILLAWQNIAAKPRRRRSPARASRPAQPSRKRRR